MLRYAGRRRTRDAAAFVLAMGMVRGALPDEEWARGLIGDLPWTRAAPLRPCAVSRSHDPWDDRCMWFLEYADHVLAVSTRRCGVIRVTGIEILPLDAPARWDALEPAVAPGSLPRVPVDVDDGLKALKRISDASRRLQYWRSPEAQRLGHLLDARLRDAPELTQRPPIEDEGREELRIDFCLEAGMRDTTAANHLVDLWCDFAEQHMDGDPLLWNPDLVDEFLLEWMPWEASRALEVLPVVPWFTYQWVLWALLRRGLTLGHALDAAVVAISSAESFRSRCEHELAELEYEPDELPLSWQRRAS